MKDKKARGAVLDLQEKVNQALNALREQSEFNNLLLQELMKYLKVVAEQTPDIKGTTIIKRAAA